MPLIPLKNSKIGEVFGDHAATGTAGRGSVAVPCKVAALRYRQGEPLHHGVRPVPCQAPPLRIQGYRRARGGTTASGANRPLSRHGSDAPLACHATLACCAQPRPGSHGPPRRLAGKCPRACRSNGPRAPVVNAILRKPALNFCSRCEVMAAPKLLTARRAS